MGNFTLEVLEAAKQVGCAASELSRSDRTKLTDVIRRRYTDGARHPYFWEGLTGRASVQNKDAWQWVSEFIGHDRAVMLFMDRPDESGIVFETGACVVQTLWECTGFEFYLTDQQATYLLCFNHHDFLIGTGLAADWIKETKLQVAV